jgi:isopentenyl-diphosphate Delta-isomerase
MEKIILVDSRDKILGYEDKVKSHAGEGILHRAFTVFIFNSARALLIQRRSPLKPLWPLYWDSSCASHPRQGETYSGAIRRRLQEELGIRLRRTVILGKFQYQERYENIGAENELCAVATGVYDGEVKPDPQEIAEWKWVDPDDLQRDIAEQPGHYSPWFKLALRKFPELGRQQPTGGRVLTRPPVE